MKSQMNKYALMLSMLAIANDEEKRLLEGPVYKPNDRPKTKLNSKQNTARRKSKTARQARKINRR